MAFDHVAIVDTITNIFWTCLSKKNPLLLPPEWQKSKVMVIGVAGICSFQNQNKHKSLLWRLEPSRDPVLERPSIGSLMGLNPDMQFSRLLCLPKQVRSGDLAIIIQSKIRITISAVLTWLCMYKTFLYRQESVLPWISLHHDPVNNLG